MTRGTDPYVIYSRVAAVAFTAVILYTLLFKVPDGELADDWMHTVIHVLWGIAAAYAGWFAARFAGPFTALTVLLYGILLMIGIIGEGLFLDREFRIPLDAAANVFHLVLLAAGIGLVVRAKVR